MDKNIAIKLKNLFELQNIDTNINNILKLRGTLPKEISSLEEEIEKLCLTIQKHEILLADLQKEIINKKIFIKQTEKKIHQYESQQIEVRNNREYDAINKELELHKLDIQLAEKFLHTTYSKIEHDKNNLEDSYKLLKLKKDDLVLKKEELTIILKESEQEECILYKKRKNIIEVLGNSLYVAYERIRNNLVNNLAVVPIKKEACSGCCIVISPQQKIEVYEKNKIVFCEHCGRILIALEQPNFN